MQRVKSLKQGFRSGKGIAIVGPGRLGQALGRLLVGSGFRVLYVAARRVRAARRAIRFIGAGRPVALAAAHDLVKAQIVLLTVADSALSRVAKDLARRLLRIPTASYRHRVGRSHPKAWQGKTVLHTCGSLPASVLEPFRRRGAAIGSLHPFQTVPNPAAGVRNLKGCYWGLEGDAKALRIARRWVKALGGIPFRVRPDRKTPYHLAAFLVCPTIVTLMDRSLGLLQKAGVPARVAQPMLGRFVAETARNFVKLGAQRALTGPAVRGDWPTIRRHLAALRRFSPDTVPVYIELLRAMLQLAGEKPKEKRKRQNVKVSPR